jgi:geranylgeranyl pyrophosphate synthase
MDGKVLVAYASKYGSTQEVAEAIEIVKNCSAIDYSREVVNKYIDKAKKRLVILPDIKTKATFATIADFIKVRKF